MVTKDINFRMKTIRPIHFHNPVLYLVISFVTVFTSCHTQNLPFISAINKKDLNEVQLGTSNYYLLLPYNFETSEAHGKEGQLGYNLIPKDISSTMFGFVEIRRGHPIGGDDKSDSKPFAESLLSGKKVQWRIAKNETGYYEALTSEDGDLNAHVSSKLRTDIDMLVSIIATLREN
jgi:hypothetical protein